MSKTMMWAETDVKGFETECLFNEDTRTYEVLVCAKGPWVSRSESFPVNAEPVLGMSQSDFHVSVQIAGRLVAEVEQTLGDF